MRLLFIIILMFFLAFAITTAHEEPAKTLKEKADKAKAALEIAKYSINSHTVWVHEIVDNKPDMMSKSELFTVRYNISGYITEMQVFKKGDSLDYIIEFTYDDNFSLLTDTDYTPEGDISEAIKYQNDEHGRVREQINYLGSGEIDSKFTYSIDDEKNQLIFNKFKPLDSIEYQIIYKYSGNPDISENTEIIKQKQNGELILRVENVFNSQKQRTQKKIYDENNSLLNYFEYEYFSDVDKISKITSYSGSSELLGTTIYEIDQLGFYSSVTRLDKAGNITSFSSFIYNYSQIDE